MTSAEGTRKLNSESSCATRNLGATLEAALSPSHTYLLPHEFATPAHRSHFEAHLPLTTIWPRRHRHFIRSRTFSHNTSRSVPPYLPHHLHVSPGSTRNRGPHQRQQNSSPSYARRCSSEEQTTFRSLLDFLFYTSTTAQDIRNGDLDAPNTWWL